MMSPCSACDQCSRRKRKCLYNPDSAQCIRCQSSSLECTRTRRPGRIGRPPNAGPGCKIWDLTASTSPENGRSMGFAPYGQQPPDPKDGCFNMALDFWMFGSTFARDFRRAIHYCHQISPWLLHEMLTAMDTFLDWARFRRPAPDRPYIEGGARSLQRLRTAEINSPQDAVVILMLGQTLAAFDALVASAGTRSILKYSLSLARPWYPRFSRIRFFSPVTISPIFWDIVDSLVHREVPIIRPGWCGSAVVDRLAGICTALLPALYELSVVGHDMRKDPDQGRRIDHLELNIRQWTPNYRELECQGFSATEIAAMRTQATLYRLAGLLLIHRLRHPLTSHDDVAESLAKEILSERAAFLANQGKDAILQSAGLPIFLALLEVPLPADEVWKTVRLRVRPSCVDKLLAFHKYFWQQKLAGFNGSLFDLVDRGPAFTILP